MFGCLKLIILFVLIARNVGETATDRKNNSVFDALVEQAMKNIRVHTNWLSTNVTDIMARLDSFFSEEESTTKQTEPSTEKEEELTSIEKLLEKMNEQISAFSKQLDKDGGIAEAASQVWKYLKDTFELQADSLNSTFDTFVAKGKQLYESINDESKNSFKDLGEKMATLWQQVYTEVTKMKTILTDEKHTTRSLESLMQNLREQGPESMKNVLEQMKKGERDGKSLLDLLSLALGKKLSDFIENPQEIEDLLKKQQ
uniref:SXP/RAL-2 family protein Ani s 5-like cation-binding domain-containing protein n=1 Tax=Trichuris muris TaxID=70415 RepID=A0A5S6QUC8_TRIMR